MPCRRFRFGLREYFGDLENMAGLELSNGQSKFDGILARSGVIHSTPDDPIEALTHVAEGGPGIAAFSADH